MLGDGRWGTLYSRADDVIRQNRQHRIPDPAIKPIDAVEPVGAEDYSGNLFHDSSGHQFAANSIDGPCYS